MEVCETINFNGQNRRRIQSKSIDVGKEIQSTYLVFSVCVEFFLRSVCWENLDSQSSFLILLSPVVALINYYFCPPLSFFFLSPLLFVPLFACFCRIDLSPFPCFLQACSVKYAFSMLIQVMFVHSVCSQLCACTPFHPFLKTDTILTLLPSLGRCGH